MKTKILFVLFSFATFNYFMASTHGFDLMDPDQRQISTQYISEGNLWSVSGEVSLLTDLPQGQLKAILLPAGTCSGEKEMHCLEETQPLAEYILDQSHTFNIAYLEEGQYALFFVISNEEDNQTILIEAQAIGGINLDQIDINNELDLQIAISYKENRELVLR